MDSLWDVYNNKRQADTNRLKAIHDISRSFVGKNPDTVIILAGQELKLAQQSKQKKYEGKAFNIIGVAYRNKSDFPKALEYYLMAIQPFKEIEDKQGIGNCYGNIGLVYQYQSNYPKSLEYYFKSLKITEEISDKKGMGNCYNNIGNVYQ
ncbi:MAG TPA: tetratricopeptide repeat protein, partial [Nitrosopumilaceae archaeon]|nr:tetratricopeptide repeat protein [Nitrosopumilaceae archaeon]